MQNFDDLDIEGRSPSLLSEEDKEKVKERWGCGSQECSISPRIICLCALNNWREDTSRQTYTRSRIDRNRAVIERVFVCEIHEVYRDFPSSVERKKKTKKRKERNKERKSERALSRIIITRLQLRSFKPSTTEDRPPYESLIVYVL